MIIIIVGFALFGAVLGTSVDNKGSYEKTVEYHTDGDHKHYYYNEKLDK